MKLFTLLIFLLISNCVFTQGSNDTTIKKRQLDSLEYVIYKLKDSLRRAQYINIFFSNLSSVDSTNYGKDSVIIYYKSKKGTLIKRHFKMYYSANELTYETVEYYNTLPKPEFIEHWELARSQRDDESGKLFTWRVYSYERFAYDSVGRVSTRI